MLMKYSMKLRQDVIAIEAKFFPFSFISDLNMTKVDIGVMQDMYYSLLPLLVNVIKIFFLCFVIVKLFNAEWFRC